MDLADLGAAVTARRLAIYFALGGLLFVGQGLWARITAAPPELVVRVAADASDSAVERAVEESILLEEARRRGWDATDPVAASHLVQTMRFVDPALAGDDAAALARAVELRMHESDPVVRARLLYRARRALASVPRSRYPTRDALEAHLAAHPERFRRPAQLELDHVFLSATRRGEDVERDATAVLHELRAGAQPESLGDSLPDLRRRERTTLRKLAERYGEDLAKALTNAPDGEWLEPVASVYGRHLLRVNARIEARVPALETILDEVREDRMRELSNAIRRERLTALRDHYAIRVVRNR